MVTMGIYFKVLCVVLLWSELSRCNAQDSSARDEDVVKKAQSIGADLPQLERKLVTVLQRARDKGLPKKIRPRGPEQAAIEALADLRPSSEDAVGELIRWLPVSLDVTWKRSI